MSTPFFSVVVPTYNRAQIIAKTLGSVLNQNFQDWECILVDDGSSDNTGEVVGSLQDKRIRYFSKRNEERSVARNYGIEKARGKYICFLDSDDTFYPNHLEELNRAILKENSPVGILNTGMNENRNGKLVERKMYNPLEYAHPIYYIWNNFMLPTSVCVHRAILSEFKFPSEFNVWEDTHLWLRITSKYPFYQIEQITAQWNIHSESSVAIAFAKVKAQHVKNYLECISDLFSTQGELLEPYLSEKNKVDYQFRKFKMFFEIASARKDYLTCARLYPVGISFFNRRDMNELLWKEVKKDIKDKLTRLKQFSWKNRK